MLQEGELINPKKAKKLKAAQSVVVSASSSSQQDYLDNSEQIMQYEKRIAEMLMTI